MRYGLIFDMDGVIVDTEPLKFYAYQKVFKNRYGVKIEDDPKRLGMPEKEVVGLFLKKYGLQGDISDLVGQKVNEYHEILKQSNLKVADGLNELWKKWKNSGNALGLATSSDRTSTEIIFDRFGLDEYFENVLTGEDVEKKKPDPEIYNKITSQIGIEPKACAVVEDSIPGITAAKSAGIKCIGYTATVRAEEMKNAGADFTVADFRKLSCDKILKLLK